MKQPRRITYLVIIGVLSIFSTHQVIDILTRFRFLLVDIMNNLTQSVVIYLFFVCLISITGCVAFFYNLKLLRNMSSSDPNLLDDDTTNQPVRFDWMYYGYLIFSFLLIGLSVFLIVKPIQENYPITEFPKGFLPYLIALTFGGVGFFFLKDGIRLKRNEISS
jgi:hypothetical protein